MTIALALAASSCGSETLPGFYVTGAETWRAPLLPNAPTSPSCSVDRTTLGSIGIPLLKLAFYGGSGSSDASTLAADFVVFVVPGNANGLGLYTGAGNAVVGQGPAFSPSSLQALCGAAPPNTVSDGANSWSATCDTQVTLTLRSLVSDDEIHCTAHGTAVLHDVPSTGSNAPVDVTVEF